MEGAFFLDIVVGKRAPVLELFPSEDEALLVGWDAVARVSHCCHWSRGGLPTPPCPESWP